MEEKIKIHLTKKVYDTLLKDCEAFEFLKKDNISLNKNAFLITLINNYYLTYYENEQKLFDLIKNTIKEETSFNKIDDISKKIVSKLNKITSIPSNDKLSCIINLKPTKDSLTSLSYIEKYLLKDYSMSEFFRNLFSSSVPEDMAGAYW